jgi:glycogen synthase
MYPPHSLGGYELMWRSAVGHLREWGHDVRVLTTDYRDSELDPSTPEDESVFRELRWYWRDHEFPRLGLRARVELERHNATVLARELAEFRPDVVGWWAMGGMSLSLIEQGRRAGLPAACVVVDDWPLYGGDVDGWTRAARRAGRAAPLLERTAGVPARLELEQAATWLFASETLLRRVRDGGWRLPDARVAHPGIDQELFRRPEAAREEWAWRLLYCGRIDERKGIDLALEALALLPPEARLRVIGAGDARHLARLRRLAGDRASFERLPRGRLPEAYAEADATVFPVRWEEPFGLVPLESMAMGTPVVASGRGGSGEYLRGGENCLLFDPDRGPPALAEALRRLAGDADLRRRLHEGGLSTAARFRAEDFDRAVEECLLEAVSRRRRPAGS